MAYQAVVNWQEGRHFEGTAQGHTIQIDTLPPNGTDQGMSPMLMLLVALGGCTGMDVVSILQKERQDLTGLSIEVNAERATDYPMVYTKINLIFRVKGHGVTREAVERAVQLSEEKYCSVGLMLSKTAEFVTHIEISEA